MDFKLLVLCVCLLCLQETTAPGNNHGPDSHPDHKCLQHHCDSHHDVTQCILASDNHWTCSDDQYCEVVMDNHGVSMRCQEHNFDDCRDDEQQNPEQCHLSAGYSDSDDCTFCCWDKSCLEQLLFTTTTTPTATNTTITRTALTASQGGQTVTASVQAKIPGSNSCFTSSCDHRDDLATCTSGQYACQQDEFCEIDADRHGNVYMRCAHRNHIENCHRDESSNGRSCYPLSGSPSEDCRYCCFHAGCVHSIAGVTSPSQMTMTPVTSAQQAVTNHPPRPGRNSCFTTDCDHHDAMASCTSGQWACSSDEFCKIEANEHGEIHFHCAHEQELSHCHEEIDPGCYPLTNISHGNCRYCCRDAACVHNAAGLSTAVPTGTTPSQQVVTTLPPRPERKSCFTTDCNHLTDLAACTSGQWACGSHEYCDVNVNTRGEIHMQCVGGENLPACVLVEVLAVSMTPSCYPLSSTPTDDCHYCCPHAECIHYVTNLSTTSSTPIRTTSQPATATPLPTTTTPTTTTSTATTSTATTTTTTTSLPPVTVGQTPPATECKDLIHGNCSVMYAGQCSDLVVQKICPRTCGVCHDCTDLYMNNCSVDFPGMCNDPTVIQVCRKTCNRCSDTTTTPGMPTTTAGTTVPTIPTTPPGWDHCVDHYRGNCTHDFPGGCSNPVIMAACEKTCGLCSTPSNALVTAQPMTTVPPTAAAKSNIHCIQCGNFSSGTPCTEIELITGAASQCSNPGESYCMTDVIVDSSSNIATYKRCVNRETCVNQWYLQTSDKHNCLTFDPSIVSRDLTCHFCCVDNQCNLDTVPDHASQWRP